MKSTKHIKEWRIPNMLIIVFLIRDVKKAWWPETRLNPFKKNSTLSPKKPEHKAARNFMGQAWTEDFFYVGLTRQSSSRAQTRLGPPNLQITF